MIDDYGKFHDSVYARDNPPGEAHGWIQWKGTDVCMDVHCACGELTHLDGSFLYFLQCSACGKRYATGCNIKLIPLTDEEMAYIERERTGFAVTE